MPNGEFTQKETTESELLQGAAARAVRFAMGKHAGAKVRHIAR